MFGVPWSSEELVRAGRGDGRPPAKLEFKGEPPPDHPLYVYRVNGEVRRASTNTGAEYDWNHQVPKRTKVELVETIPSWREELMPFKSKRQQRAMFAGAIPGLDKSDAKEWAKDTNFKKLPERAPAEKGKPTLRSKKANGDMLQYFIDHPDKADAYFKRKRKRDEKEKKAFAAAAFAALEPELIQVFKTAALGSSTAIGNEVLRKYAALGSAVMNPNNVGKLRGMMTTHAMKAPGYAASTQAMNPRKNVIKAMNVAKPH